MGSRGSQPISGKFNTLSCLDTAKIIYLLGVYFCQEKCLRSGQAHKFKGDSEEDLTVLGPSAEWHLGG